MTNSIESLETRRLFSVATHDERVMLNDERNLISLIASTNKPQAAVRAALHTDVNRLHLLRANVAILVKLARDESTATSHLRRDAGQLKSALTVDARVLLSSAFNYSQHQNNKGIKAAFSATLSKFEKDQSNYETKLAADNSNASTGVSVTDLTTIASISTTDLTLQSDVQAGLTNLTASSASVTSATAAIDADVATFLADSSGVEVYGNANLLGMGFPARANPFSGATLTTLTTDATSVAISKLVGPATFSPAPGAYAGTDQIYVGSDQVAPAGQLAGPQVITLDYSPLTKLGHPVRTLTLGIATDGFENPTVNIPYTVSINGIFNAALTSVLNSLNDADRVEQYVSVGIDPAQLLASKVLTISIDGPGDSVSGWAVDFLTVGIKNG